MSYGFGDPHAQIEHMLRLATMYQRKAAEEAAGAEHYRDAEEWDGPAILCQKRSAEYYRRARSLLAATSGKVQP